MLRARDISRSPSEQTLDQPAVDLHRRAGDVRGRIRQQEGADAAEVVGVAVAPERNGRSAPLLLLIERDAGAFGAELVEMFQSISGNPSGQERVDSNAIGRQFE